MGTRTIISGLSPEIALTLQTMGVELQSMQTALTVEQALEMLGLRVVRPGQKKASASAAATAQDDGFRDRSDMSFEGSAGDSMEFTAQPFSLASRNPDRAPITTRPPRR
jgi:rsbT antagonist protein RsbS